MLEVVSKFKCSNKTFTLAWVCGIPRSVRRNVAITLQWRNHGCYQRNFNAYDIFLSLYF